MSALTSRYFARSSVEKLPIPCRLFVHANLRVAQGSNAEGARLRYDSAAQIHAERRHAAGRKSESAGIEIDPQGVFVDGNPNDDEDTIVGLSPGTRRVAVCH